MTLRPADPGQVGAVDEVHDDEVRAPGGTTEPLRPDDVRMMQPGDRARLADESPDDPGMLQEGFPEEFHGDVAARPVLPRLVHLPHPPRADQAAQQEISVREQEHTRIDLDLFDRRRGMRGRLRGKARPGRLLRDLGVDPEQLRGDLLPSLAESGQEFRV